MRQFSAPASTALILRSLNGGPLDDHICSECGRRCRHHSDGEPCLVRAAVVPSSANDRRPSPSEAQ